MTILLSGGIIAGAVFCLKKKYKLKGFTILALILAVICLSSGVGQAGKYGVFTKPKDYEYSSKTSKEKDTVPKGVEKGAVVENETEAKAIEDTVAPAKEASTKTEFAQEMITEETDKEEPVPESSSTDTEKTEIIVGVDPDLKAFLDSYEAYIDEYVVFMKKYNSDSNNMVSMLGEYGEMMQKYADFADKLDKYDSDKMSTEDYKYYIEVTSRCSQKMLDAY